MPKSIFLLDISRIACELGFTLGTIVPLLTIRDGSVFVSYYIDMQDAKEQDFLDAFKKYSGPKLHCPDMELVEPDFQRSELRIDQNEILTLLNNVQGEVSGVLLHPGLQKPEK